MRPSARGGCRVFDSRRTADLNLAFSKSFDRLRWCSLLLQRPLFISLICMTVPKVASTVCVGWHSWALGRCLLCVSGDNIKRPLRRDMTNKQVLNLLLEIVKSLVVRERLPSLVPWCWSDVSTVLLLWIHSCISAELEVAQPEQYPKATRPLHKLFLLYKKSGELLLCLL